MAKTFYETIRENVTWNGLAEIRKQAFRECARNLIAANDKMVSTGKFHILFPKDVEETSGGEVPATIVPADRNIRLDNARDNNA
jgi:hypothetical protein